ncbi:hypothetical protein J5N97_020338 [Dioscorea zingiberensis]|uniref:PCI domain-containing protein n=1 Tax=Dioscorea zingiberensis TaxID=325984 RepID=A0A9D5HDC1_9LILI|nr:hypothetical protein J5N97_020338 [Dioscorea zingiberensis]
MEEGLLDEMRKRMEEEIKKLDENLFEEGGDWEKKNRLQVYQGLYKSFFSEFSGLTEQIKLHHHLHPHIRFYMREVRTVIYSQFLESYKSVTMEAMATAFGVTVDFIDLELSRLIAAGKLHCKIDKVAGVLETNRPDAKNALYQATIKQGDFLLDRIQNLSRVIDL